MDRDNEIELIETIQEKDRRIKELEAMSENIGRELLARTDELNEVLEKQKNSVPKDKIKELMKKYEEEAERVKISYGTGGIYWDIIDTINDLDKLLEEE